MNWNMPIFGDKKCCYVFVSLNIQYKSRYDLAFAASALLWYNRSCWHALALRRQHFQFLVIITVMCHFSVT